jgi:hypothetical protein
MTEDLGEEDIVGLVLGASQVAGFQGSSREPKAAETYFGSWGAGGGVNGLVALALTGVSFF